MIFMKKLFNAEVFYSVISVNKRFTTIASDSIFTNRIKWFNLESTVIDYLLLTANYSNFSEVGLYNIYMEKVKYLSTSNNHIESFVFYITDNENKDIHQKKC